MGFCADARRPRARHSPGPPSDPLHGRDLGRARGHEARLPERPSRLVQPRPGPARGRRRWRARRRASTTSRSSPRTTPTGRSAAPPSCARRSRRTTTASTGAARARSTGRSNVCVAQGGRLALTRAFAALGPVNVGYQLPDYTAYEDMFDSHLARLHRRSPIRAREEDGFRVPPERARARDRGEGPGGVRALEPVQPDRATCVQGAELAAHRATARASAASRSSSTSSTATSSTRATASPAPGPVSGAPLRRGRRARPGAALRRPDEELPLPRLARRLGRRARAR